MSAQQRILPKSVAANKKREGIKLESKISFSLLQKQDGNSLVLYAVKKISNGKKEGGRLLTHHRAPVKEKPNLGNRTPDMDVLL